MVHWLPLMLATAALRHAVGDGALYPGEDFTLFRVDPLSGDVGVALLLILVVSIAAMTYRSIEAPWRSFGRALASSSRAAVVARAA